MGAGLVKGRDSLIPDLESFKSLTKEYDKLKSAGLTADEIHALMMMRATGVVSIPSHPSNTSLDQSDDGKDDQVRQVEQTKTALPPRQPDKAVIPSQAPLDQKQKAKPQRGLALLIDDSPVAAKIASKVLQTLNFEVIVGDSAQVGFDLLKTRWKDVKIIFLDVVMPNVDGVECLSWIKSDPDTSNIPVYMLSGLDDQTLNEVCVENGAEGMLLKPLNIPTLKTIIRNHKLADDMSPSETTTVSSSVAGSPPYTPPTPVVLRSPPNKKPLLSLNVSPATVSIQSPVPNFNTKYQNTASIGSQMTAFRLTDSDAKEFVYPSMAQKKYFLFAFIPTIFFPSLYNPTDGFLIWLNNQSAYLQSTDVEIVLITADLPMALSAGKKRFQMPFVCLADPSLSMSKKYTGSFDAGAFMAHEKNQKKVSQPQQEFIAPHIGLMLVDVNRFIIAKWMAISTEGVCDPGKTPPDLHAWIDDMYKINLDENKKSTVISDLFSPKKRKSMSFESTSEVTRAKGLSTASDALEQSSKKYVLVVDDSSVSSRVVTKKLESLGYQVESAYNGLIAFDMVKKDPKKFAVVMADVVMPVCDGIKLLKMIKSEPSLDHVLVVMLSGMEGVETTVNCLQLGAAGLLKKPFDADAFQSILRESHVSIL